MSDREFDVVVLGASGFAGSLVAQHLASAAGPEVRVALAGRSRARLDAVRDALLTLDTADVEAIGAFLDVDPAGPLVEVDVDTDKPLFDLAKTLELTSDDV